MPLCEVLHAPRSKAITTVIILLIDIGAVAIPRHSEASGIVGTRKEIINTFKKQKKDLLAKGYESDLGGLSVGFIAPEVYVENRPTLSVSPVANESTFQQVQADSLKAMIEAGITAPLKDTNLFSSITNEGSNKSADFNLKIVINNYYREICIWTINVYDKHNDLVASGTDMVSSAGRKASGVFLAAYYAFSVGEDYFAKEIIERATMFVGCLNKEFKKQRKEEQRRRW